MKSKFMASAALSIGLLITIGLLINLRHTAQAAPASGIVTTCDESNLNAALATGGSITFSCGPATIVVSSQKVITQATSIDGGGVITISGGGLTRTFYVKTGAGLALSNLTLYNGQAGSSNGGAIYSLGALTITTSSVLSNSANIGGAVRIDNGAVFITGSTFISNYAQVSSGALDDQGSKSMRIINSIFHHNVAVSDIGALALDGDGPTIMAGSQVHHNQALTCCRGGLEAGGSFTLTNSSIYGNSAPGGAGLQLFGVSHLSYVQIYENMAAGHAGGVLAGGNAFLDHVDIYSNTANYGGGISSIGRLTMTNSLIHQNTANAYGAGLLNYYGNGLWLTGVDIYSNTVLGPDGTGAGLYHYTSSFNSAVLDRVRIYGNRIISGHLQYGGAGLGVFGSKGPMTLTHSSIYNNVVNSGRGGGIHASYGATLTVINSAVYSNSAPTGSGGGIDVGAAVGGARVTLINSTLSNNDALKGGGLSNASINSLVVLTNVTLYSNTAISGGSISGTVQVLNTIIAGGSPTNCNANLISAGHNLESNNSCGLTATGDLTNTNPQLGAFQNNGGFTLSYLPQAGSPVINAGSMSGCPATDQRGLPRLGPCDIGAIERQASPVYLPLTLKNF